MSIPIIKIGRDGISLNQLVEKLGNPVENLKFVLKFKKGMRYKLRKFKVVLYYKTHCECCGTYEVLSFANSKNEMTLDSHTGISYLMTSNLV